MRAVRSRLQPAHAWSVHARRDRAGGALAAGDRRSPNWPRTSARSMMAGSSSPLTRCYRRWASSSHFPAYRSIADAPARRQGAGGARPQAEYYLKCRIGQKNHRLRSHLRGQLPGHRVHARWAKTLTPDHSPPRGHPRWVLRSSAFPSSQNGKLGGKPENDFRRAPWPATSRRGSC